MRGYPLFNFPAFDAEAERLRALGHKVFSLAERDRKDGLDPASKPTWQAGTGQPYDMAHYMAIDLPEVCKADAVVVLPGWEKSEGCNYEVAVARAVKRQVLHAGTLEPVVTPMPQIFRLSCAESNPSVVSVPINPADDIRARALVDGSANPKDILGMKKPPMHLVPSSLKIHVAKVMELGARKYGPYNWRQKKVPYTVYLSAAMRHLDQALDGEDADPESGQPHAAHAAACMGIILDALACDCLIDDRPAKGAASRLISEFTEKT
jgi:hypothetical protein